MHTAADKIFDDVVFLLLISMIPQCEQTTMEHISSKWERCKDSNDVRPGRAWICMV